ncbi:MAG: SPOR domain-containing protein [Magnetococcales bacterium]|nr:SPOR domain-containing protein [Magnetococcales bacterium]
MLFGTGKKGTTTVISPPVQEVMEKRTTEVVNEKSSVIQPQMESRLPSAKDRKAAETVAPKDKKTSDTATLKDKKKETAEPALTQEEKRQPLTLKVSDAIVLPTKDISQAGKKNVKGADNGSALGGNRGAGVKKALVGAVAPPGGPANSGPASAAPVEGVAAEDIPPLPKGLAPKTKPPDVELTFYDALANRKVILPPDTPPPTANGPGHGAAAKHPATTQAGAAAHTTAPPRPQGDKKNKETAKPPAKANVAGGSGAYMLQLGVFSSHERAMQLLLQLQNKGQAAQLVQSEGPTGLMYRVRSGPYPSLTDAKAAMVAMPKDGTSPVIIKP